MFPQNLRLMQILYSHASRAVSQLVTRTLMSTNKTKRLSTKGKTKWHSHWIFVYS